MSSISGFSVIAMTIHGQVMSLSTPARKQT